MSNNKTLKTKYFKWYEGANFSSVNDEPIKQHWMTAGILVLVLIVCVFLFKNGIFIFVGSVFPNFFVGDIFPNLLYGIKGALVGLFLMFLAIFIFYHIILKRRFDYLIKRYRWKMRYKDLSKREEELRKILHERREFNQLRLNAKKEGVFDKNRYTGRFLAQVNKSFRKDIFQELDVSKLEEELQEIKDLQEELSSNSMEAAGGS